MRRLLFAFALLTFAASATAMTLDEKSDMLYVTEYSTGRLVVIPMR